jgi:hypothetical protein
MDDPAIIAATWSSAPTTPSSFPVPFAGFFCNNPPSTGSPTKAEKPKPQKLKKLKKLAPPKHPPKHPVYYPVYEPMKFHPGALLCEPGLTTPIVKLYSVANSWLREHIQTTGSFVSGLFSPDTSQSETSVTSDRPTSDLNDLLLGHWV